MLYIETTAGVGFSYSDDRNVATDDDKVRSLYTIYYTSLPFAILKYCVDYFGYRRVIHRCLSSFRSIRTLICSVTTVYIFFNDTLSAETNIDVRFWRQKLILRWKGWLIWAGNIVVFIYFNCSKNVKYLVRNSWSAPSFRFDHHVT